MVPVLLALGSNQDDPARQVRSAFQRLVGRFPGAQFSSLYESPPMYYVDQPPFINAVALIQTDLGPLELLTLVKSLEQSQGRTTTFANGPRVIDIDILSYGSLIYTFQPKSGPAVQIPHARMEERRFVLEPLAELCPEHFIPGKPLIRDMLRRVASQPLKRVDAEL